MVFDAEGVGSTLVVEYRDKIFFIMNNENCMTQTYYFVGNRLYPYNPSLEDELNRLLGWSSSNYLVRHNDFGLNGIDTEHCPDETSSSSASVTHGPPGCRTQHGATAGSNNSFFSTPMPAPIPTPSPKPSPQPRTQPSADREITSSVFPSASRRTLRKKLHCSFCKNNGERELVFASHNLKTDDGVIICPVLRNYTCPICHANGDRAHTLKYCPMRATN